MKVTIGYRGILCLCLLVFSVSVGMALNTDQVNSIKYEVSDQAVEIE